MNAEKFEEWKETIGTTIGEASMLWDELPKGVFESTRAIELNNRLIALVEQAYKAGLERAAEIAEISCCDGCAAWIIRAEAAAKLFIENIQSDGFGNYDHDSDMFRKLLEVLN